MRELLYRNQKPVPMIHSRIYLNFDYDLQNENLRKYNTTEYDILGHELKHAYDNMHFMFSTEIYKGIEINEYYTTAFENRLRKDEKNPSLRLSYAGRRIPKQYNYILLYNNKTKERYLTR